MSDIQSHGLEAAASNDAVVAVRNALKLGLSLMATWGISVGVRFLLPRYLGPEVMGPLTFAESFPATFFIALSLGVEMYIHRELPVRPEHGSDFFGSITALRVVMTLVLVGGIDAWLMFTDQTPGLRLLVLVFAGANFLLSTSGTLSAMLHASTLVDGLSWVNVISKLIWGGIIVVALALKLHLAWIPGALLLSELFKCIALYVLARRHVGLSFTLQRGRVLPMVMAGLPFYLNAIALNVYGRLAITVLNYKAPSEEVAWYGQALALAQIMMMAAPIVHWVLMPMFARAANRDFSEMAEQIRRSVELILSLAFPVSLVLWVGADLWVHIVFGPAFAPSADSLRLLAPIFVLTYLSTLSSIGLIQLRRAWYVTLTSIGGMVLNCVLNLVLIDWMATRGDGGAGSGAALSLMLTELCVALTLLLAMGKLAFDRRSLLAVVKTLGVYAGVIYLDKILPLSDVARVAICTVVYGVAVVALKAVRVKEVVAFIRMALRRRGATASA